MKFPVFFRLVHGISMEPTISPGSLIIANRNKNIQEGNLIIAKVKGREIIKRVNRIHNSKVYILGDNPGHSTDSRSFGWLEKEKILGRVVWPRLINERD